MLTTTELPSIFEIPKEQIKELLVDVLKDEPDAYVQSGSVYKIRPNGMRRLFEQRGYCFPQKKVITFAALKGGIGKTTLSINIAVRAAALGAKVLLVDLDPEACATNSLLDPDTDPSGGMTFYDILKRNEQDLNNAILPSKYENLEIIPSALVNHQVEKFLHDANPKRVIRNRIEGLNYNLIFLELPPSFTKVTGSAYLAADLIVLPCTPDIYSYESITLTIQAINELADEFECPQKSYRILMNQFNPKRIASQDILGALADNYKDELIPTYIKESAEIANAANAGLTVFDAKASKSIRETFDDITLRVCGFDGGAACNV